MNTRSAVPFSESIFWFMSDLVWSS